MFDEVTRILAVRHGETAWNVDTRLQGQIDISLNATGQEQARRLAEALAGDSIDAIVCSDLVRARDTAQAVADRIGLPLATDAKSVVTFSAHARAPYFDYEPLHWGARGKVRAFRRAVSPGTLSSKRLAQVPRLAGTGYVSGRAGAVSRRSVGERGCASVAARRGART